MRFQTRRCRKHSSVCLPKHFFVWLDARSEENAHRSTGVCVSFCRFFLCACQCVSVFMCVCFLLAGLECFCCFSLAGCSDWLALGRGDIMFSPKPTCIPHPPSTAATIVSECVCVCVDFCASVRERKQERECQREVCAFRRSHTLLFLLKCSSSPWRRLMRYDITALCFIFKRWAGSPSLPLNEAEVPTEYMESVCVCVCVRARSHSCLLMPFVFVHRCGCASGFLHTLSLTPILPITPGISCPEAMCQTSLATASITPRSLSFQHHIGNISRTAALTDYLFLFTSAAVVDRGWFGFCLHICPSCWSGGARCRTAETSSHALHLFMN